MVQPKKTFSNCVFSDICKRSNYDTTIQKRRLHESTKDSLDYVQRLTQTSILKVHKGCVNTVFWDKRGQVLLSGSDDQKLVLTDPFTGKVRHSHKTSHRANIFSAKFLADDDLHRVVSCSGDGIVAFSHIGGRGGGQQEENGGHNSNFFECHNLGTTYEVLTVPTESNQFMSCGEDATVRLYDLREATSCHKSDCTHNILINGPAAITTMDLSPTSFFYMALGSSDGYVRIYDRRYLCTMEEDERKYTIPMKCFSIPAAETRAYRITSVGYGENENELLVSYSSEHLYLFNPNEKGVDFKTSLGKKCNSKRAEPPLARRLRIRGDWTDTGPESRPLQDFSPGTGGTGGAGESGSSSSSASDGRQTPLVVSRIAEVLSRILASSSNRNAAQNEIVTEDDITDALHQMEDRPATQLDEGQGNSEETQNSNVSEETLRNEYSHIVQKYTGHRNARTMIKESSFWGKNYVMSGSDCGHIFVWDKQTGKLANVLQGDHHVVNCIQPHPTLPIMASSGIDYDIKIWMPMGEESNFEENEATKLMKRNDIMLEETRDTVTIPASFMIILLSSLPRARSNEASGSVVPSRYQSMIRNLIQRNRARRNNVDAPENASASPSTSEPQEMDVDDSDEEAN